MHRDAPMVKSYSMEAPARERGEAPGAGGQRSGNRGVGVHGTEQRPGERGAGDCVTGQRSGDRAGGARSGDRHRDRPGEERYRDEDFPGCESFHLPAGEVEHYEGRLEFWDGLSETAWKVSEPTSIQHEGPSRRLVGMATRVAALRGSGILCLGSSDLVRRDASGRLRWLMQADEVLYLHPRRVRLTGSKIDVDADPLPDVALEVDHSTDVRRRKLGIYKESGFPEVWVLVPWESSRRAPELAIHVRRGEGYREEGSSRAFPGWRAEEIHRALTEEPLSAGARRALERVALAMGAREGTRPEDDPFTRTISMEAEARGRAKGRGEERATMVRALLRARGIEAALDAREDRALFGRLPGEALTAAALACTGEADFRRRIRERLGPRAESAMPPTKSPSS